jgi:F-type H+-transporting ATPase subunit b
MTIDWWTLALQTVNVLILVWILGRFFFRPVMAIVARRQEEASKLLGDAAAARDQAAEIRAAAERERAGIAAEKGRLASEASAAAEKLKADLLTVAAEEAARMKSEAKLAIERDRAASGEAMLAGAADLSVEISTRLLGRVRPGEVLAGFLDDLRRALRSLPPDARASLLAATAESPIVIVVAQPLAPEGEEAVRTTLREALGAIPALAFRVDAGLIAGVELEGRNVDIRNSLRADLQRIRQELADDGHH